MLRFYGVRPRDMRGFTMKELGAMRESLDDGQVGVTDGP